MRISPAIFLFFSTLIYSANQSINYCDYSHTPASVNRLGITESYEYNTDGTLKKKKWKKAATDSELSILYENYHRGIPQKETHPESVIIERKVNDTGTIQWEKNGEGYTTSYQYDALNRVKKVIIPIQDNIDTVWIDPTHVKTTRGNRVEEIWYDAFGREVLSRRGAVNDSVSSIYIGTRYTQDGRVKFKSNPSTNWIEPQGINSEYDALGRLSKSTITATGATTTYFYGSVWNAFRSGHEPIDDGYAVIDGRGNQQVYNFTVYGDPSTRMLKTVAQQTKTAAEGGVQYIVTNIQRNKLGNITQVTQGGKTKAITYYSGKPNLVNTSQTPETGTTTYTYDDVGNLKTLKVGSSPTTSYTYDNLNRLTSIDYPSGTSDVTYSYDKTGKIKSVNNQVSLWNYTYNAVGQLTNESLSVLNQFFSFGYSYDSLGSLNSMTYPNELISYAPNVFGQPTQIGNYITSVTYHPNGQTKSYNYRNGHKMEITQNNRGLPETIRSGIGTNYNLNTTHTFDGLANITQITDHLNSANTKTLGYDGANRLITANSNSWGGNGTINYDNGGNITSKTIGSVSHSYTYDTASNRLSSVTGGYSFGYDVYGNVTNNGKNNFTYDAVGNLIAVGSQPDIDYGYDDHRHRVVVTKEINGQIENYFSVYNQSGQLLHRKDASSGVMRNYFYLNRQMVASIEDCTSQDTDGDKIPDCVEDEWGLNKTIAMDAMGDLDNDGVGNLYEYFYSLNPKSSDTVGNGFSDLNYVQVVGPGLIDDEDHDYLNGYAEFMAGTNPLSNDTDGDGLPDNTDSNPLVNWQIIIPINYLLFE